MSKIKKTLALLLAVVMTIGMMTMPTLADGTGDTTEPDDKGLLMNKVYDSNTGMLTLEAYATGESYIEYTNNPADIVLVLDVSGSMDEGRGYYPVYDIQDDGEYYYKKGWSYEKAYFCNKNSSNATDHNSHRKTWWTEGSFLHTHGREQLFPKKSANDTSYVTTQFYTYYNSKLDMLKEAANDFIATVKEKSPESQIAIVKFAGDKRNTVGDETYRSGNTETGFANYSQIVKNLTTVDDAGKTELQNAISSLRPSGATHSDFGMQHAQAIIAADNSDRQKVVVMFTDGEPTSTNGFEIDVANSAISAAKSIKDSRAIVYTIGCFSGADGTPVSNLNNVNRTNKYMHLVSSNYKNADSMTSTGTATYPESGSYYMAVDGANGLAEIFKQISSEIGGATNTTLTETTVLKDIVSEYFDLPTGAKLDEIKAYTMTCTAIDSKGNPTGWQEDANNSGLTVNVDVDNKTITVTGFNYSENWVGSHDGVAGGKKLVLVIPIEDNKTGYGTVPTNTENSGLYDESGKLLKPFNPPTIEYPYITIVNVHSDGTDDVTTNYRIDDIITNGKASLTDMVTNGYLYGGTFKDPACENVFDFKSGESGVSFTPENGKTYYIWEVSDKYLMPKSTTLWNHVDGTATADAGAFFMTAAIDRLLYNKVGFDAMVKKGDESVTVTPNEIDEYWVAGTKSELTNSKVYDKVEITKKNGKTETLAPGDNLYGNVSGSLICYEVAPDDWKLKGGGTQIVFSPYWVTLDGVKVKGSERTCKYLGVSAVDQYGNYYITKIGEDVKPVDRYEYVGVESSVSMLRAFSMARISLSENEEPITPKKDYLTVKYFELGWFRVYGMTLLSAIDNEDYQETGFIINGTKYSNVNVIDNYGIGTARLLFGENVARDAKLMKYDLSLRGYNNGETIEVTPYWVTSDGNTVEGTTRTFTYYSRGIKG